VRGDAPAAVRFLERAAALLPAESSERPALLSSLGRALIDVGAWDRARNVLSEAEVTAERVGDPGAAADAALGRVFIEIHKDAAASHAKARVELENAVRVFEALGDKSGISRALDLGAMLHMWSGENARATEEMELAARYAREAGDRPQEIEALSGIVITLVYGPEPVATALAKVEEIERQSGGARRLQATALRAEAGLQAMLGEYDKARQLIVSADRIATELGLEQLRSAGILRMAGEIELMAGDAPAAERFFREAYERLERDKDWGHLASIAPLLAETLLAQGREHEAETLLDMTPGWAIEDDAEAQTLLDRARSKLARLQRDSAAAERYARSAVERVKDGDGLNAHAGALVRLADALELRQRADEASAVLRDALVLYERKGNVVAAERVQRRLVNC
jgi:tetratricopeptide (TPR) repeat protein